MEVEKEKEVSDEGFIRGLMFGYSEEAERVLGSEAEAILTCKQARDQVLCEYYVYKIHHFIKLFHDVELSNQELQGLKTPKSQPTQNVVVLFAESSRPLI